MHVLPIFGHVLSMKRSRHTSAALSYTHHINSIFDGGPEDGHVASRWINNNTLSSCCSLGRVVLSAFVYVLTRSMYVHTCVLKRLFVYTPPIMYINALSKRLSLRRAVCSQYVCNVCRKCLAFYFISLFRRAWLTYVYVKIYIIYLCMWTWVHIYV